MKYPGVYLLSIHHTVMIFLFLTSVYLSGQYHAGYQEQMLHWPEQPVNTITKWLKDHSPSLVVADFGCGMGLELSGSNKFHVIVTFAVV